MRTTSLAPVRVALLLAAMPLLASAAQAGGPSPPVDRRLSTSMTMLVTPATNPTAPPTPSNGVGVRPAKPIVSNPYQVPLLQNAGSFGSAR